MTTEKKKFPKLFFQILAIVIALLIAWTWNTSTLFINQTDAPEGYLPLQDYFLVDYETGQQPSIRSFHFDSQHAYMHSTLESSRGLRPGDSWDKFVEVYGNYNFDTVYISDETNEEPVYEFIDGPMLVKDFDEKYIKSGIYNLNSTYLDIDFSVQIWGPKVQYTAKEKEDAISEYYDNSFWIGYHTFSFFKPKIQIITMNFSFVYPDQYQSLKQGGLFSIMTYKYIY